MTWGIPPGADLNPMLENVLFWHYQPEEQTMHVSIHPSTYPPKEVANYDLFKDSPVSGAFISLKLYEQKGEYDVNTVAVCIRDPKQLLKIADVCVAAAAALRQLIDPAPVMDYAKAYADLKAKFQDEYDAALATLPAPPAPESAPCPVCSRELMPGEQCPGCQIARLVPLEQAIRDRRLTGNPLPAPEAAVNTPGPPIGWSKATNIQCKPSEATVTESVLDASESPIVARIGVCYPARTIARSETDLPPQKADARGPGWEEWPDTSADM